VGKIGKSACIALALGVGLLCSPPARAAGPPQIAATWVTDVTSTSASLHARVNPEGLESSYRFEYLTEAAYQAAGESFAGAATAPSFGEAGLGSEESEQPALQQVTSLKAATTYRYRIVVTSGAAPAALDGPALAFTTQPGASFASEECPNAQLRFEDGSFSLPDCRAWELVSPLDKNGGAIQGFGQNSGGDVLQAAPNGEAATFSSSASFAGGLGAPTASQYIARRVGGEAGWASENITQPTVSGAYPAPNSGVPYQLFSADLARGLLLNGARCGEGEECPRSYSLRESAGGALTTSPAEPDLRFAGASPDLGQVILSTCAALTPDATEVPGGGGGCEPSAPNLYEWSEGALTLINLLPGESHGTPGAHLAAQGGAVSTDGQRVYFSDGEDSALYLREAGGPTKLVPETVGGGASFQTASADGSLAFFLKGAHLFRYSAAAQTATDLTPSGGVEGVLGASADGSHVYYATAAGLFLWQAPGPPTALAPSVAGIPAADPSDYPPTTGTARLSAGGSHLAFLSEASLTGYDNTDQQTGEPDSELFLYDAGAERLVCVSCNPTGERPGGPSTIPGAIANGDLEADPAATDSYKPRDLSAEGNRLFFDSRDAIVPGDGSAAQDVYEWEAPGLGGCAFGAPGFETAAGGCLALISSGESPEASSFVDASTDGRDAFFLSGDSLLGRDPGSVDLYDAREGGGVPEPQPPIPCEGDACQAVPSPPEDPAPGTIVAGSPNPPPHFTKPKCKTGFVRKHGKCSKKPGHKKKSHHRKRSTHHKRGGRR
jgi:hypothetical protein